MQAKIISFIVELARALLPWLVSWASDYLARRREKHERDERDKANQVGYKEAVKNGTAEQRAQAAEDLLNNRGPSDPSGL